MHASAQEFLPIVSVGTLLLQHPIYISSAKGARVIDVDGNEYIDLTMGFGPHILGHSPSVVLDALREALDRGLQVALHNPYQEPLARLIVQAHASNEMVVFCNSGTEATMYAIRALRAFTRRPKIAQFEGSYHGAHDYALVVAAPDSPPGAPRAVARQDGIPPEVVSSVVVLPFWRDEAFDMIRSMRHELAAVLIEPVQGSNPQLGHAEWLRQLREICNAANVPLVFDEVITGFRLGYGGAQEFFGIGADVITYGKVIGGGLPVGAVTGRRDVMELFTSGRVASPSVFSAGTFSGNPMSMVAGTALLSHLKAHPELYTYLWAESDRFARELNTFFTDEDFPAQIQMAGSSLFMRLTRTPIRTAAEGRLNPDLTDAYDALQLKLLDRGVILPGVHQFHLSTAHTRDDVDTVIAAVKDSFREVRSYGLLPSGEATTRR